MEGSEIDTEVEDIAPAEGEATFLEHLEDLRYTIIKSVLAFVFACIIVACFMLWFADALQWPLHRAFELAGTEDHRGLITNGPMSIFSVIFQLCFLGGFGISIPFILFFFGQFVAPGLTEKERRMLIPGCFSGLILFLLGVCFAYLFVLPASLIFSVKLNQAFGLEQLWNASNYYGLVVWVTMGVGMSFQFPLVLLILNYLGIISTDKLKANRRVALLVIIVAAALITPGGDLSTLIIISLPLYILFEASLIIGQRIEAFKAKEDAALEAEFYSD